MSNCDDETKNTESGFRELFMETPSARSSRCTAGFHVYALDNATCDCGERDFSEVKGHIDNSKLGDLTNVVVRRGEGHVIRALDDILGELPGYRGRDSNPVPRLNALLELVHSLAHLLQWTCDLVQIKNYKLEVCHEREIAALAREVEGKQRP